MAITLRSAKKKREILPEENPYKPRPRLLGDSGGGGSSSGGDGGGDGGGGTAPSGGDGGSAPSGEGGSSYSSGESSPGVYGGESGYGPAPEYSGWGGEGSPLYGTGGGGNDEPQKEEPQLKQSGGGGGGLSLPGRIVGPAELIAARNRAIAEDNAREAAARSIERYYNPRTVHPTETPAQLSARNIAEQSYYQKLINSQGAPPGGFGMGGASVYGGGNARGTGETGGYATGLIPPSRGTTLEIPEYDQGRVEALAQRVAAPSIRKLRSEVQSVQGGVYDNPNVKSMTLRQALQGYGSGLESVMGGALSAGAGMYKNEYDPTVLEATTNYRGNLERELQAERLAAQERISAANIAANKSNSYQNAWNEWRNVWA